MIRRVEVSRSAASRRRSLRMSLLEQAASTTAKPLDELLAQPEQAAAHLRALRVEAGLSGYELAASNGWSQAKVSRIETGKQMPSAADIRAWVHTCGQMASGQPALGYDIEIIPVWAAPDPE